MLKSNITTCIIIEDEPPSAFRLEKLLENERANGVEIAEIVLSADRVEEAIRAHLPDLVFMDVKLADTDAFTLLNRLRDVDFEIVFTSGHREFAPDAFRIDAVDYLLKPIDREELRQALDKYRRRRDTRTDFNGARLLDRLAVTSGDKRIPIHTLSGIEMVSVRDIIYCEADANYTHLFLRSGEKLTVSRTLKEFEAMLGKLGFFRVHHSHLVNLREIKSYGRGKGGVVILSDKSEIEVSIRKKDALLAALKNMA